MCDGANTRIITIIMLKQYYEKNIRHYARTTILVYSLEKTSGNQRSTTVPENRSKVISKLTPQSQRR